MYEKIAGQLRGLVERVNPAKNPAPVKAEPSPRDIQKYLRAHGLVVQPASQSVPVPARAPTMGEIHAFLKEAGLVVMREAAPPNVVQNPEVQRPLPMPMRAGGGGAAFTGVRSGCYAFGTGEICVNGRGQITKITPGGGGGGGSSYPYTVGPTGTNANYTTINAALTQALIDIPDPDVINPITIYIFGGNYTEDVTLGLSFTNLVGVTAERGGSVIINGSLTIANTALSGGSDQREQNRFVVSGLEFTSGLTYSGTLTQSTVITNCVFDGGVLVDNTSSDGSGDPAVLRTYQTRFKSSTAAVAALTMSSCEVLFLGSELVHSDETDLALHQTGGIFTGQEGTTVTGVCLHDGGGVLVPITAATWWLSKHSSGAVAPFDIRGLAAVQIEQAAGVSSAVDQITGSVAGGVTVADWRNFPAPASIQAGGGLVVVREPVNAEVVYVPVAPGDWAAPPPDLLSDAVDRLAAANPGA